MCVWCLQRPEKAARLPMAGDTCGSQEALSSVRGVSALPPSFQLPLSDLKNKANLSVSEMLRESAMASAFFISTSSTVSLCLLLLHGTSC